MQQNNLFDLPTKSVIPSVKESQEEHIPIYEGELVDDIPEMTKESPPCENFAKPIPEEENVASILCKGFYPTPRPLAMKMIYKIQGTPSKVLEPSAGRGDLIDALKDHTLHKHSWSPNISAIEINQELQSVLRGKNIKVIDSDFLQYAGSDAFDLIIANPPFDTGGQHLIKALDILFRGQLIFILNAETLKNPHTNFRKDLVRRLEELNADIEYHSGAFKSADRPTGVEVALISIIIDRKIEDNLFEGCTDKAEDPDGNLGPEKHEVSTGKKVEELVAEYNEIINIGTETILAFYKNWKKIGRYLNLNAEQDRHYDPNRDLTATVQTRLNEFISSVRKDYWRKTLDLREVNTRLTEAKQKEFEHLLEKQCDMDFTVNNIRQFVLNLIGGYEQTITDSILAIFDKMTKHSYRDTPHEKNIHYYNGWKTNNAYKVKKKVIIPMYPSYGTAFVSWSGGWDLDWKIERELRDIDLVMNYFDGMEEYSRMGDAIKREFKLGNNSGITSTYFTITCHKKGTIHLIFNSEDILRRFNLAASQGKNWLPEEYGTKPYGDMTQEEKTVVDSFEGEKSYTKNLGKPVIAHKEKQLKIELLED